jgi:two-component system, NarL family, sensor kinase
LTGYINPMIFFGCLIFALLGLIFAGLMMIFKLKTEKHKLALAHDDVQTESDLLRLRLEIQQHALNTICNEIHDNIGQMLSGVHMRLVTLGYDQEQQDSAHLSELATYMGRSIRDLRNLGHASDSLAISKIGLVDAIEKEIAFASSIYDLHCIFTCENELPQLSRVQEALLFRIAQGMIDYMFGYCRGGQSVHVTLGYQRSLLLLKISDPRNDTAAAANLDHDLPQGIADRIKLVHGRLRITNQTKEGTTLTFICNLKYDQTK